MNIKNQLVSGTYKQLFDLFIEQHKERLEEVLGNKTITLLEFPHPEPISVIPSINGWEIIINNDKLNSLCLDKDELFACIFHEFGHIADKTPRHKQQEREFNADKFACEGGGKDFLICALQKILKNTEGLTEQDMQRINERISRCETY